MPPLDFVTEYSRVMMGDSDGPDPFDGISGILDNWFTENWTVDEKRRPRPWSRQILLAPDDGDPGHAQADRRALDRGVDVTNSAAPLDLLQIARSQIGSPYIWADANPQGAAGGTGTGFDCSGYTQWVLSRFGIQTVHMASEQQQQFRSLKRNQLQPGDLVFYNYGRKAAGVADHVAVYIGGGRQVAASSSEGQVEEQPVDWEHFIGGGATGIAAEGPRGHSGRTPVRDKEPGRNQPPSMAPTLLIDDLLVSGQPAFGTVLASLMQGPQVRGGRLQQPRTTGRPRGGATATQLYNGFMDAGRPDLARMVRTEDFKTWIDAESGWNVDVVSKYYAGHGRNYGLFQFWEGHPWTNGYLNGDDQWTADAYTQAKLVARYFPHLSPADIRRYADQVRNGSYSGWG